MTSAASLPSIYRGSGFDFSNHTRNTFLEQKGVQVPKATSTGTTIVGCLFDGGVVLGADTRATEGEIIADKNCEKIHYITENIRCCGAGTAADTEFTTAITASNMELHQLMTRRKARVVTAMTRLKQYLFQYEGHVGAALVIGGVDPTGAHLFTIHPHGSTDKLPYVTMGSGSLAAMAVFESRWKPNMPRDEAINLVVDAVHAGIFNDLGSGSNCDVCVITEQETQMLRGLSMPNPRVVKQRGYRFSRGATAWLKEDVRKLIVDEEVVSRREGVEDSAAGEAMDTS